MAAFDVGGFNEKKVNDQLRIAFQASQVKRKATRHMDTDTPRKKRRRTKKTDISWTSSDEEGEKSAENLREDDSFQTLHIPYTSYTESVHASQVVDATKAEDSGEEQQEEEEQE